jgi:hypothetical protein
MRRKLVPNDEPVTIKLRDGVDDGKWHHSEFPHPLVTLDYDIDGNLLEVSVVNVKSVTVGESCAS